MRGEIQSRSCPAIFFAGRCMKKKCGAVSPVPRRSEAGTKRGTEESEGACRPRCMHRYLQETMKLQPEASSKPLICSSAEES